MAIDSIGANRNFIAKKASFINKQNKAEQKKEDISLDKFERKAQREVQREETRYERIQNRRAKKNQPTPDAPVAEQPVKPVPIETAPVEPIKDEKDINSYAQKYVALYEKNSGRTLSQEDRAAKVSQVAEFYSAPSRSGRLGTLVDQLSA